MNNTEKNYRLINGVGIPKIGFGTWQIPNGEIAFNAVLFALKNGYRHIDTANAYGNEKSVGLAVRESGIPGNEIFVTTKLPAEIKTYKGALENFEKTMENLGLGYTDLYLIHAPWPWGRKGEDFAKENIEVWRALEEFYQSGRCRAIGVSNFNVSDLNSLMGNCQIKPMVNQIKFFIGHTHEEITTFCQQHDILVEGYSPLASGAILENKEVKAIAKRYEKTLAQICIRYVLQRGVLPLPKSTHNYRIQQNLNVDFEISEEDMKYLNALKNTVSVFH
jgi:diketogulonate reductase-like aldo/keto reductase